MQPHDASTEDDVDGHENQFQYDCFAHEKLNYE